MLVNDNQDEDGNEEQRTREQIRHISEQVIEPFCGTFDADEQADNNNDAINHFVGATNKSSRDSTTHLTQQVERIIGTGNGNASSSKLNEPLIVSVGDSFVKIDSSAAIGEQESDRVEPPPPSRAQLSFSAGSNRNSNTIPILNTTSEREGDDGQILTGLVCKSECSSIMMVAFRSFACQLPSTIMTINLFLDFASFRSFA